MSACASVSLFKTQSQNKTDVIDSATSQANSCSHFFFNVKVHTPTSVLRTQLYVYSSLTISKKLGVWQRQLQHGITTFRFVSEIFLKTKISTERWDPKIDKLQEHFGMDFLKPHPFPILKKYLEKDESMCPLILI